MPIVNKLTTEFEVLDSKAIAKTDAFVAKLQTATKTINALPAAASGAVAGFDKQIAAVERRTLSLAFTLNQFSKATIGTAGLDGLGKAAGRAEIELRKTYARLQAIEAEAAKTRDPVVLQKLTSEAAAANNQLDRLQQKMNRVNDGRSAVAARQGAGAASGLTKAGSALGLAGAAGVPFASEAALGLSAAEGFGITAASIASVAAFAAALAPIVGIGAVIIHQFREIKDLAAQELRIQEKVSFAYGQQAKAQFDFLNKQKELDNSDERARKFEAYLKLNQKDAVVLQARADLLEQINKFDPTGKDAQANADERRALIARVAAIPGENTAAADANFAQRNENFKNSQKQAIEFEKQRNAEKLTRINEQRQRVNDLGKSTDDLFAGLYAKQGTSNPFVAVFSEADKAIESTRIATAGLSKDLQETAARLVAGQNATALFTARLDNSLNASDLSAEARMLRRGRGADSTRVDSATVARIASQYFNDNFQTLADGGTINQGMFAGDIQARQIRQIRANGGSADDVAAFTRRNQRAAFEEQSMRNLKANGQSDSSIAAFIARSRRDANVDPLAATTQDRLNRQLEVIRGLNPNSEAEKAIADRKIIALTNGLKPEDLSPEQRNAAAAARENEAVRIGNAEKTAIADRESAAATQASIDKNIAELLKIAQKDGLTGVIRIINDAEEKAAVSIGKRPTIRDAKTLTDL